MFLGRGLGLQLSRHTFRSYFRNILFLFRCLCVVLYIRVQEPLRTRALALNTLKRGSGCPEGLKHCLPRDLHPPAWSHSLRAPKAFKTETPIRKWAFKPWHREYCRCHQMHMIMFPFGRTTRDLSLMTEPCEWETIRGRCWNVSMCDC